MNSLGLRSVHIGICDTDTCEYDTSPLEEQAPTCFHSVAMVAMQQKRYAKPVVRFSPNM